MRGCLHQGPKLSNNFGEDLDLGLSIVRNFAYFDVIFIADLHFKKDCLLVRGTSIPQLLQGAAFSTHFLLCLKCPARFRCAK